MKILDLLGLTELVKLCKEKFAAITYKHTVSDITDYTVDDTFSSTSTNPIFNIDMSKILGRICLNMLMDYILVELMFIVLIIQVNLRQVQMVLKLEHEAQDMAILNLGLSQQLLVLNGL